MKHLILLLSLISSLALGANQTLSTRLNVGVDNIVVPGTSSGLVSASGLPVSSTAIGAGYAGNILSAALARSSAAAYSSGNTTDVTAITLTPGNWLVMGTMAFKFSSTSPGITDLQGYIAQGTNTGIASSDSYAWSNKGTELGIALPNGSLSAVFSDDVTIQVGPFPVNVAVSTTKAMRIGGLAAFTTGTATIYGSVWAVQMP